MTDTTTAAHRAEYDRLFAAYAALYPGFRCFCGSLEDLREAVARGQRDRDRDRER